MLAAGSTAIAGDRAESPADVPVLTVPYASAPPVVDGVLDDSLWSGAVAVRELHAARDRPADQERMDRRPTTIRVAWDAGFLYVAFECLDDHIDVDPALKHDDALYLHDVCEVFLDPVGDGLQYLEIQVSPLGQTIDLVHLMTTAPVYTATGRLPQALVDRDFWSFREWEADGLRAAAGRIRQGDKVIGWTVELAIPAAAALRRPGLTSYVAGEIRANFARYDYQQAPGMDERQLVPMYWSSVEWGCPHISAGLMGRLELQPEGKR